MEFANYLEKLEKHTVKGKVVFLLVFWFRNTILYRLNSMAKLITVAALYLVLYFNIKVLWKLQN